MAIKIVTFRYLNINMKTKPSVSVVVPTYNYARFLDEAIESVLTQSYQDFELIIVDDNSQDDTDEVVQKYLSNPKVSYYKNEANLGVAGNFSQCLKYVNGKLIKYLNSDDKFHPLLLEKFVAVMDQYPNVSLVISNQEIFGDQTGIFDLPFTGLQPGKKIMEEILKSYNWIGGPTSVMLRSSNLHLGGFREKFNWMTDMDMWLRHLAVGDCYILPERLVSYRVHSAQGTVNVTKDFSARFEEYEIYRDILENNLYGLQFMKDDLNRIKKIKAASCASIVYKMLPELGSKKSRSLFKKAWSIASREKVLLDPFLGKFKTR